MSTYRYRQYRTALKATPFKGKLMPYSWGSLPSTLPFQWIAYSEMFDEFARELANSINALSRYVHQLAAWRDVVSDLTDSQKFDVAVEFVDPLATLSLNLPYVIRSRFVFASAHLCHQAAMFKTKGWKDDLPLDEDIFFDAADVSGRPWRRYGKLKQKLERIGDRTFQAKTKNFRNTYNHRFSPRIVFGHTNFVTRRVDGKTGAVSTTPPLTLELVVELLEQQCEHCYKAFDAFQALVREHEGEIEPSAAKILASFKAGTHGAREDVR